MVSFRFHLVSLIAVFLALALGIAMGVTVIDRATVNLLQQRLDTVGNEVDRANQRSDQLQQQLSRSATYEERVGEYLLDGRLVDVPITVIAVRGTDEDVLEEMRTVLTDAGATVQGTLWLSGRVSLADPAVLQEVRDGLAIPGGSAAQVRQATLSRIAATFAGASEPAVLEPLVEDGLLDWEGDAVGELAAADFGAGLLIVASSAQPDAPNAEVALPLTRLLAAQPARRLMAVEPGRDPDAQTSGQRAVFVGPLRSDADLEDQLSTVDNIEMAAGRVATVLALSQLPEQVGDYGVGQDAGDGIVPALTR